MSTLKHLVSLVIVALFLVACAAAPKITSELENSFTGLCPSGRDVTIDVYKQHIQFKYQDAVFAVVTLDDAGKAQQVYVVKDRKTYTIEQMKVRTPGGLCDLVDELDA